MPLHFSNVDPSSQVLRQLLQDLGDTIHIRASFLRIHHQNIWTYSSRCENEVYNQLSYCGKED